MAADTDMIEPTSEAAHIIAASHATPYDPFDPKTQNQPDQRYWCDRSVWDAYQASLLLVILEERNRCRKIIQKYAERAPVDVRETLFELIRNI
jgi:hypothetical protein